MQNADVFGRRKNSIFVEVFSFLIFSAKQAAESFAVDPKSVFANNEVDLSTIDVYGFDYDYTLACYTCELHHLIYKEALENLVDRRKV